MTDTKTKTEIPPTTWADIFAARRQAEITKNAPATGARFNSSPA